MFSKYLLYFPKFCTKRFPVTHPKAKKAACYWVLETGLGFAGSYGELGFCLFFSERERVCFCFIPNAINYQCYQYLVLDRQRITTAWWWDFLFNLIKERRFFYLHNKIKVLTFGHVNFLLQALLQILNDIQGWLSFSSFSCSFCT